MPSHLHEVLIEMFRERPAFAAELLSGPLGVAIPAFDRAGLSSGDLTAVAATEYRADAVVTFSNGDDVVLAVVVEVQLRIDPRKRRTWPAYVATLHARLGCPTMLLVLSADPAVAVWCAAPIVIGEPGLVLTPVVLGPETVPLVTDPAQARRHPELAVLSAMAHGGHPDRRPVFEALLSALEHVDLDHASLYADIVLAVLPAAAREYLEVLMTTTTHRYQSDFARRYFDQGQAEGKAEGKAQGKAESVLQVLDGRGIAVPDAARADISSCTDLAQLDTWLGRALVAETIDELFA